MAETDRDADPGVIGETGSEVIGGQEIADAGASGGRDPAADPDLEPIHGGDISDTPAAQGGTRGAGTGGDVGTGAEVGINRPGAVAGNAAEP